ncbi:g9914 [Coccomyxa viridis]|uniref:G9914 protein n=1 Tax=Coccomyxa viridis TaxID=1274662 RepID=A0ABP1G8C7_9CHLO
MQGLISSTPTSGSFNSAQKGILKLGLSSGSRDGYIYVPSQYDPTKANAMILAIHAAGRGGLDALQLLIASANSSGIILLAPDSRAATWDDLPAGQNSFGPDVAFISAALAQTFALYNVDPTKLGIQGFSDGATYALGLGMINGKLFKKVIANSPGGILADSTQGQPPVFISAGLQDNIFPIQQAGNADACYLKQQGYAVTYVQFNGGHEVPATIASDAIQWFQGSFQQAFPQGICGV